MNRTNIEWTDFSANPLRYRTADGRVVWACEKLSPGCKNCYAKGLADRYTDRRAGDWNAAEMAKLTPFLDEAALRKMLTAKRVGKLEVSGRRCFVGDMTDIFGEWVPTWMIAQLFGTLALRYDVTWQVLTKRASRLRELLNDPKFRAEVAEWVEMLAMGDDGCDPLARTTDDLRANAPDVDGDDWPLPNVWIGVSCEDQQRADERIPELLKTPAAVRFISAEPLLGPINVAPKADKTYQMLSRFYGPNGFDAAGSQPERDRMHSFFPKIDWLIVGGESGHDARPCEVWWIDEIVDACKRASVACFVKQAGSHVVTRNDSLATDRDPVHDDEWPEPECGWDDGPSGNIERIDDGYQGAPIRIHLRDRKGGDLAELPRRLRVREFPRSAVSA